jgi:hypothetical protein
VHGVAHLISAGDWEWVKATEGVRLKHIGYQVITIPLKLYDGRTVGFSWDTKKLAILGYCTLDGLLKESSSTTVIM